MSNLDEVISNYSYSAVLISSIFLFILTAVSLVIKKPSPDLKKILFGSIATITIVCTLFLAGSTLYLNSVSSSKGPVHWHADLEIWDCGQELDLKDPKGFSNKVGTSTVHEHNDKRIHIEGVLVQEQDASLGRYFSAIGGQLHKDHLALPTHEGMIELTNGDLCPNGNPAFVQVFVYRVVTNQFIQSKVADTENYLISPQTNVPPGDCIIVEFDQAKDKTDKLCKSYRISREAGKLHD